MWPQGAAVVVVGVVSGGGSLWGRVADFVVSSINSLGSFDDWPWFIAGWYFNWQGNKEV